MKTSLTILTTLLAANCALAQVYFQSGFNAGNNFGLIEKPYDNPVLDLPGGMNAEVGFTFKSKWQLGVYYQYSESDKSNSIFPEKQQEVPSYTKTFGFHPSYRVYQRPSTTIEVWLGMPLYFTDQTNSWRTGIYNAYNPNNYSSGTDRATFFSIGIAPSVRISPQGRQFYIFLTPSYSFHHLQRSSRHIFITPTIGEAPVLEDRYIKSSFMMSVGFGYRFSQN